MSNVKVERKTVSCVSLWDILDYMEFRQEEQDAVSDFGLSNVSFGDAAYTLIGNNYALSLIQDSLEEYYDELESLEGDNPSRMIPARIYTREEIADMFWAVVGEDDYINLESH